MITTLLKANDIAGIFILLKDPANDLLVHDGLFEHAIEFEQYFIVKALKVANESRFYSFAQSSAASKHGHKVLFTKVLSTFYKVPPHYLEYCHAPKDGIPGLQAYIDIANSVFNS